MLVNNAAVMPDGPILDVTEAVWDATFAVNVRGHVLRLARRPRAT